MFKLGKKIELKKFSINKKYIKINNDQLFMGLKLCLMTECTNVRFVKRKGQEIQKFVLIVEPKKLIGQFM